MDFKILHKHLSNCNGIIEGFPLDVNKLFDIFEIRRFGCNGLFILSFLLYDMIYISINDTCI